MNNIHEKDWAELPWCGHSGMDSHSDWCTVKKEVGDNPEVHTNDGKNGVSPSDACVAHEKDVRN